MIAVLRIETGYGRYETSDRIWINPDRIESMLAAEFKNNTYTIISLVPSAQGREWFKVHGTPEEVVALIKEWRK